MRLIDADDLIEYIKIWDIGNSISSDQKEFIDCVNRQFTAFDVDKVVESLMNRFRVVSNDEDLEWNRAIDYAIKIVKGGGVDGKADDKLAELPTFKKTSKILYHPSIHMPKEAARIWLKVTNVRVERLQDMTDDDAEAEGAIDNRGFIHSPENEYDRIYTAREHFIGIWDRTIKKSDLDHYGWDANPWVWVIEFERCEKPKEV